jgi:UrcA family protein
MSKGAFTVALFLAAAGLARAAQATIAASPDATETRTQSAVVRYHAGQLGTSRGAQTVYASIDRAARDVCDDTGEFVLRASFAACERGAIADAIAQVDSPRLTAVYNDHFPNYPLAEATSLRLIPAIIVIVG